MVSEAMYETLCDEMNRAGIVDGISTEISTENPVSLLMRLVRSAARIGIELKLDVETIVATAKKWYDEKFAPQDLRRVPNFIEPAFDNWLWSAAEYALRWTLVGLTVPEDVPE